MTYTRYIHDRLAGGTADVSSAAADVVPAGADKGVEYTCNASQGNIRQVTDSDGNVEQDSHYYPYGMLMGESSDILATARNDRNPLKPSDANPYLYGGKEYLTTAGANLLDFTARTYDPSTLLFHTPDPLRDKYLPVNSYLYCLGNPINYTDPTGMSTYVEANENETYKVVGGCLDDDLNIYLCTIENGILMIGGETIGKTPVVTSFYNSDEGTWAIGAIIDPADESGVNFISSIIEDTPSIISYALKGYGGQLYDFKITNGTSTKEDDNNGESIYRGMPIPVGDEHSETFFCSARDIGNIVAGYVSGYHGLTWNVTRFGFDGLQTCQDIKKSGIMSQGAKFSKEGISSQNAQKFGYEWGSYIRRNK